MEFNVVIFRIFFVFYMFCGVTCQSYAIVDDVSDEFDQAN